MADLLDHVQFGAAIEPGDKVLLTMTRDNLTREHLDKMREQLNARHPDIEFTIVVGVSGLAIQRGTEAADA